MLPERGASASWIRLGLNVPSPVVVPLTAMPAWFLNLMPLLDLEFQVPWAVPSKAPPNFSGGRCVRSNVPFAVVLPLISRPPRSACVVTEPFHVPAHWPLATSSGGSQGKSAAIARVSPSPDNKRAQPTMPAKPRITRDQRSACTNPALNRRPRRVVSTHFGHLRR